MVEEVRSTVLVIFVNEIAQPTNVSAHLQLTSFMLVDHF